MRTIFYVFLLALGILGSGCSAQEEIISMEMENPSETGRSSALVIVSHSAVAKKANGKPAPYYEVNINKKNIPVQFDDLDGDGQWDELVFLHDFKPKEKLTVSLRSSAIKPIGNSESKAHVRHRRLLENGSFGPSLATDSIDGSQTPTDFGKQKLPPFLTEGPAWENDRVGFRLYFDTRNGKDIWGKLKPEMVLDNVGTDSTANYHALNDWGMDLLKVGSSLGAGALALFIPNMDGKDTLVRVGGSNMGNILYERVADGPVRAIFRMHYKNWKLHPALSPVSLTEEIQIWGGQLFYESVVRFTGLPANTALVTGIVNLYDAPQNELLEGRATAIFTHHKQSENKDKLAMAILMNKEELQEFSTAKNSDTDIRNTYLVKMKTRNNQPNRFRFYAAWEKSVPALSDQARFEAFLKDELKTFQQPIVLNE